MLKKTCKIMLNIETRKMQREMLKTQKRTAMMIMMMTMMERVALLESHCFPTETRIHPRGLLCAKVALSFLQDNMLIKLIMLDFKISS